MTAPTPLTTPVASSCAGCIFGAVSSTLLSYTYHPVEIITVSVTPHAIAFANGTTITTSLESNTVTKTGFIGGNATATNLFDQTTFSSPEDVTWTIGNATLMYPNTYVQYLGFAGAADTTGGCIDQAQATRVQLPAPTDRASFIYSYTQSNANLPSDLMTYLESLPTVSNEFQGQDLGTCHPLAPPLASSTATTFTSPTSTAYIKRRFEGARHAKDDDHRKVFARQGNDTAPFGTTAAVAGTAVITTTRTSRTASQPRQSTLTLPEVVSPGMGNGDDGNGGLTIPTTTDRSLEHTTAFVISAITGKAIVTPVPAESLQASANRPVFDGLRRPDEGEGEPLPDAPTDDLGDSSTSNTDQVPDFDSLVDVVNRAAEGADTDASHSQPVDGLVDAIQQAAGSTTMAITATAAPVDDSHPTNIVEAVNESFDTDNAAPAEDHDEPAHDSNNITPASPSQTAPFATASEARALATPTDTPGSDFQVIAIGGERFAISTQSGAVMLVASSSTMTVPAHSATMVGTVGVSIGGDRDFIVVGSQTATLAGPAISAHVVITAGRETLVASQLGSYVVVAGASSTLTLAAGDQTVWHQDTIRADSGGSAVVINGRTTPLTATRTSPAQITFAADGSVVTAVYASGYVILGDSVSTTIVEAGGVITFGGREISILPGGNGIVLGGSTTMRFNEGHAAITTDVGEYIAGGITRAGEPTVTATSSGEAAVSTALNESSTSRRYPTSDVLAIVVGCMIAWHVSWQ